MVQSELLYTLGLTSADLKNVEAEGRGSQKPEIWSTTKVSFIGKRFSMEKVTLEKQDPPEKDSKNVQHEMVTES